MGSFLGSPYRGNTESGRVDHCLQELLVKIGLCTPFEDIVFGAALSADKHVPLTVSLLAGHLRGLVEDEGLQLRGRGALRPAEVEDHVYTKRI